MSTNFDVIVIFPIYGEFGLIQKPDSGRMVYDSSTFTNDNLLANKN